MRTKVILITVFLIFHIILKPSLCFAQSYRDWEGKGKEALQKKDYSTALKYFIKSKELAQKEFGNQSNNYSNQVFFLASAYEYLGNNSLAEQLYLEYLEVTKNNFGEDNVNYLNALNNLSDIYQSKRNYTKSIATLEKIIQVAGTKYGESSPVYCRAIGNLAVVYHNMGFFSKAEKYYLQYISLSEKYFANDIKTLTLKKESLGSLYLTFGNYRAAEKIFYEVLVAQRKHLDWDSKEDKTNHANTLIDIGTLNIKLGNYKIGKSYLLQGSEIIKGIYGKNSSEYVSSLHDLTNLSLESDSSKEGESTFLKTTRNTKKIYGEYSSNYSVALVNLAGFFVKMGKFKSADSLLQICTLINGKIFNKTHPVYIQNLENLAILYYRINKVAKADSLYEYILKIRKATLKNYSDLYTNTLLSYCTILFPDNNKYLKVNSLLTELMVGTNMQIKNNFAFLSEQGKQDFLKTTTVYFDLFNAFLFKWVGSNPQLSETSYNNELQNKVSVLRSIEHLKNVLFKSKDSTMLKSYEKLAELKRELFKIYSLPINRYPNNLGNLELEAENLDKELVRKSQSYNQYQQQLNVTWQNVQQKLKPNEAAIEFVWFRKFYYHWSDSLLYGALVLRPGFKYPKFVYLFEQQQVNSLLKSNPNNDSSLINALYSYSANKNKLNSLIWQPLDSLLQGMKTIYAAPSGILNKINLGAIPINADSTFGTKYNLHILGTTADIINYSPLQINKNTIDNAYLFGGIDYDNANNSATISNNSEETNYTGFSLVAISAERGYVHSWSYLPGTLKEGFEIQSLCNEAGIKTTLLSGRNASETNFKSLSGSGKPFILHLATHGYFFPDIKKEKPKEASLMIEDRGAVYKSSENPLLRSGLILAGANKAWGNDNYKSDSTDDGILTAYEVSKTDLSKAQLVVMSACETGLGDIEGSEGVFGLQRGFKLAGAKDIIMSLWKVPDAQTSELLTLFYTNCLQGKMVREALQSAQLQMQKKYPPYYWAAFKLLE